MKTKSVLVLTLLSLLLAASPALAQDDATTTEYVPTQDEFKATHDPNSLDSRKGLDGTLGVSANLNLIHNHSVVGQVEGFTTVFGLGLTGGLDWLHGRHEIRNTLSIDESWARTPTLEQFVKNSDSAQLTSQYDYFFLDWMGAYARLSFDTSLFPTYDYRSEPHKYEVKKLDGKSEIKNGTELKLSGSFQPFNMSQSIGIVADPLTLPEISLTARIGLGGRENFTKGVLLVEKTDAKAKTINLKELDNVYQFGAEAYLGAQGKFYQGRLTYSFGVSALIPFANNDPQNRSAWELTRFGANASAYFAIFSWMGLTYKLYFVLDPQLTEKAQVQNSLLATFNYTFIERGQFAGPSEAEAALEQAETEKSAAEKRAEEAEARAQAAEQRAAQLEAAANAAKAEAAEASAQESSDAANAAADAADTTETVETDAPAAGDSGTPSTN